jgi:hypothetical protein
MLIRRERKSLQARPINSNLVERQKNNQILEIVKDKPTMNREQQRSMFLLKKGNRIATYMFIVE